MRAAPTSLDPADSNQPDWLGSRNLFALMFDTLVSLDEQGKPEPALASSWQAEPGNQRWQFFLRRGVTFPGRNASYCRRGRCFVAKDESNLESILRRRSCRHRARFRLLIFPLSWLCRATALSNATAERSPALDLLPSRSGIRERNFLLARDDYWGGRAFLDAIEIEMGKTFASR